MEKKEWPPEVQKLIDEISEKLRHALAKRVGEHSESPIVVLRRLMDEYKWPEHLRSRVEQVQQAIKFVEGKDQHSAVPGNLYTAALMTAMTVGGLELPHPDEAQPDGSFILKDLHGTDSLRIVKVDGDKITLFCMKPIDHIAVDFTITKDGVIAEPS